LQINYTILEYTISLVMKGRICSDNYKYLTNQLKKARKDGASYICEKYGNEMFKFSVKDKNLFTADNSFIYRKYLNTEDPNGPYYTC